MIAELISSPFCSWTPLKVEKKVSIILLFSYTALSRNLLKHL